MPSSHNVTVYLYTYNEEKVFGTYLFCMFGTYMFQIIKKNEILDKKTQANTEHRVQMSVYIRDVYCQDSIRYVSRYRGVIIYDHLIIL